MANWSDNDPTQLERLTEKLRDGRAAREKKKDPCFDGGCLLMMCLSPYFLTKEGIDWLLEYARELRCSLSRGRERGE